MDPRALAEAVRARARSLGADLVGIAPASLPDAPGGPGAYREWVEQGMHGTMGYMARDPSGRDSITRWFPGARSVILLGFCYAPAPERGAPAEGTGRLAAYALSDDYHDVLRTRLKDLLSWLQQACPGLKGKSFVDTSPVLERLYARYAGLGWVGKNTMMIHPRLGSQFFLTGLAVDREIAPDRPETDHCGSCRRCLDACPTDAFPAPRVLDASRCIAYFTIEHRGPIPEAFRPGIGDWVYGCDDCQDVCPWNRFSARNPLFQPLLPARLPLEELARLSEEEFERRFARTPLERGGRKGLVRNALLAMGNSGDPRYRSLLERFAEDADPLLAEQASWSLNRLAPPGHE